GFQKLDLNEIRAGIFGGGSFGRGFVPSPHPSPSSPSARQWDDVPLTPSKKSSTKKNIEQEKDQHKNTNVENSAQEEKFREIFLSTKNVVESQSWCEYLAIRKISPETCNKVCGLNKKNLLVIPISDGEKIVGIKYRSLEKKVYCEKLSSSEYLFNWQKVQGDTLIIVEGEFDLMSAIEVGYENCVSLPFGAGNTKCIDTQKSWLTENFKKIIIATDNDESGQKCKHEIWQKLSASEIKFFEIDNTEKDFNDILMKYGKEKLCKIIESATEIIKVEKESNDKSNDESDETPEFRREENAYYKLTKIGYEKITDFVLTLKKFSHNFFEGESITKDYTQKFRSLKTDLLSKQGILKHWGFFFGNDRDIPKFLFWLQEENNIFFANEIEHYGIIGEKYYDTSSNVICGKNDLFFKNISDIGKLSNDEKSWLKENLLNIRKDKIQSLVGLCWAVGRFHQDGQYPILEVCGTTSRRTRV
ncbi:MAG: toprim domain-containing protein, partial [Fusobacteriaceae bacterium]